ncbi:MAG: hypothetical protein ACI9LM_003840 [Alteromonadaceae bacterium]|jgi:hypothetical protein
MQSLDSSGVKYDIVEIIREYCHSYSDIKNKNRLLDHNKKQKIDNAANLNLDFTRRLLQHHIIYITSALYLELELELEFLLPKNSLAHLRVKFIS